MGNFDPVAAQVGFVGAGQLARMTVQAAIPLGVTVRVLATRPDESAALICPHVTLGVPTSLRALSALAELSEVVTFDHELVDAALLRRLEGDGRCLRPSAAVMAVAQDKVRQRIAFATLGLPAPPHRRARDLCEVTAFAEEHGWPVVLKSRRGGYDGRGVWTVESPAAAERVLARAAATGHYLMAEPWIPIEREVAVIVARRPGGESVTYPVVETVQANGICREIVAPAAVPAALAAEAQEMARRVADGIEAVGILALELFVADGRLIVNELAARPPNSGHYSLGGCVTSQFENHLRAVLDWPLGSPALLAPAVATVNVIPDGQVSDLQSALPAALAVEGVQVHLYGKEPRPGRKLGHVTALGDDPAEVRARAHRAAALLMRTEV